ncbi:hypothetical protein [Gilvimarinus sp. 1_MG-2023]|uniref:hypothetical protein n=1 Tax=Gilvimarinus sp. 1_MG-2023 TaxID=3062638 RepID=UPI0026E235FF|nr:hypothetical protein [Gilvimarinus sp. 1_MG-2023]MDO6746288.1 hypothetical protein [Gilvimarinus sp. 1_MG-2023]
MANTQTIAQWQQILQALIPVEGWLYIGAGRGEVLSEPRFAKVPRLLAVEADEHASQMLTHAMSPHRNWKALHALVDNTAGQASWHQHSHEGESGLLPAENLSTLWPNIQEQQHSKLPATSLSQLMGQTNDHQEHYNWLTIDCLPAARLLQGLGEALQPLDIIEVRVAINGLPTPQVGATLEECDHLLLPQGFKRLALEATNNPLLGKALYGRAFKQQLAKAQKINSELEHQNSALNTQCAELKTINKTITQKHESTHKALEAQKSRELQVKDKLQQAQEDVVELENQKDNLASQYAELKVALQLAQQNHENTQSELEAQRQREAALQNQLQLNQTELKEYRSTAKLSTKLLTKIEADASDLRERYSEKIKSEQELKDLVKELHAKLQAASHFYHQIEQEHPELLEKL